VEECVEERSDRANDDAEFYPLPEIAQIAR
jgi:hypothetical protein